MKRISIKTCWGVVVLAVAHFILGKSFLFVGAIILLLVLEYLFPVDPDQEIAGDGFLQDSLWFLFSISLLGIFVKAYHGHIRAFSQTYLDMWSVRRIEDLPEIYRLIAGFIVGDLLAWCHHWLMHHVPWFWQFHKIHHSQLQINPFTTVRTHPAEHLLLRPIVLIPLILLSIDFPKVAAYAFVREYHSYFYHSNIKTNLSWLRYIFVTPQSHRIHHSLKKEHFDKNLGVSLSIWDQLFGTQYRQYDEYPVRTGINDTAYPMQRDASLRSIFWKPIEQFFYPLKHVTGPR